MRLQQRGELFTTVDFSLFSQNQLRNFTPQPLWSHNARMRLRFIQVPPLRIRIALNATECHVGCESAVFQEQATLPGGA